MIIFEIGTSCADLGVLVGKGGMYGNVFRIKPPMCFNKDDAGKISNNITNLLSLVLPNTPSPCHHIRLF